MEKTAAVKKLGEERGILVKEAERQLDVDTYLKECQQWVTCRLHHLLLLHRMFLHAVAMGWREYDCAIQ